MEQFSTLFIFSYLFLLLITAGEAASRWSTKPTKIFVFGDSYADTGNVRIASSWKQPYGITFPGKPYGRFSDGRVYTDYFAKFLGVRSPIPYRAWMKYLGGKKVYVSGINFAYGGSGVFDTYNNMIVPNMTTQIDFFERLVKESHVITKTDLQSSVVHVSLAGNDYAMYGVYTNGTFQNTTDHSKIFIVDLYRSFTNVINHKGAHDNDQAGDDLKFETPLTPCCKGIRNELECGDVDANGTKMYTVCSDPKSSFFWDMVHPTNAGWRAVYANLKPSLQQFFHF
ncbi:hypothetical protein ACJIZ3_023663 [Penstemon smallii]|uniref:Uncharacterized protein n=1 Tax=Penstemon smallii TaxID=265156 RepID=A0ABD3TPP3_9LAMI